MKVTAIIPTLYDKTSDYLPIAVQSLRETVDWDIIVVSNGTDVKPLGLTEIIPGVTIHLHTPKQGQCNAVNIGAQVASPNTDYIMVLNDDMYFAPGWNKYLRFDDPCFSPNLVEPVNNAGSAPPFLKADGGLTSVEFEQDVVNSFILENIEDHTVEDGFNLPFFIRKDVWQTIGGYDIAYDPWGSNSDTDLQTKIELAGIKPKRYRDVLVYHFGSKSGTFEPEQQAFWQRNWDYYTEKWGFNRDMEPKADTWYCKNMIHYDKLKYNPPWRGIYEV